MLDRLDELLPQLDPFRSNLSKIMLGRTAVVLARYASGDTDVDDELRDVVSGAHRRQGSMSSLVATMLLARYLRDHAPDLIPQTRERLERFGDKPILAGFGIGSFGPTTRYVAQLPDDENERKVLLDRSVVAADRHGPLLWSVHTRLDRAALGAADAFEQARVLSLGTELESMVAKRGRILGY